MKKTAALCVAFLLLFSVCGCTQTQENDEQNVDSTIDSALNDNPADAIGNEQETPGNDTAEQPENTVTEPFVVYKNNHMDCMYSVVDGRIINLCLLPQGGGVEERAAEIDNEIFIQEKRFVFCSDGTVVDMYDFSEDAMLTSLLTQLYNESGITDVVMSDIDYYIYAGDGCIYLYPFHGGGGT